MKTSLFRRSERLFFISCALLGTIISLLERRNGKQIIWFELRRIHFTVHRCNCFIWTMATSLYVLPTLNILWAIRPLALSWPLFKLAVRFNVTYLGRYFLANLDMVKMLESSNVTGKTYTYRLPHRLFFVFRIDFFLTIAPLA